MRAIPTIETERLRPMQASDWEGYWHMLGSEQSRYMGGPFARNVAWGMFCADHAMWEFHGCGALMLECRSSDATLGQVGINSGPLFPERELGWMLYAGAEGKGYGFEAAQAMRLWAREQAKFETLVSYVDPGNTRSIQLARRLGAILDPHAPRPAPGDLVFRHFGAGQR